MMWLTKNPEDYGVIVAGNMFGDIVSDGFAGLIGGLGFAASANLGQESSCFRTYSWFCSKVCRISGFNCEPNRYD